jgi:hypothetical protein
MPINHQPRFTGSILVCSLPLLALACLLAAAGCRQQPKTPAPAAPPPTPLVVTAAAGPVECRIAAESDEVRLERDLLLTIQTRAPEAIEVRLPPLNNRLTGFVLNGEYDNQPVVKDGIVTREHCVKLTPTLAEEYRLGPLAVAYTDRSRQPPIDGWFATRPLTFKVAPVIAGKPAATIADILGPEWIWPPFKTVALWIGLGLAALAALYGLWFASKKIKRAIQLRLMSPKERALHELAELLARELIAKNQLKEFYLEITLIVRRYIERAHRIRAPEQTTEEFLVAVTQDRRFSREIILKLKTFLQTADLVKFAAFRPDAPTVDKTVGTAKDYIETDEQESKQPEAAHV